MAEKKDETPGEVPATVILKPGAQEKAPAKPEEAAAEVFRSAGLPEPRAPLYVVPLASADTYVGALVLLDPDGETPDDRLMESYASRAATAYLHAVRGHPERP